ncbi:hypothetical protein SO802_009679 [Lithocarpus litseifolius]|uniref:Tyrosine decarboxylase n=1 Tax=Lithocarpus litseifolius TaxID=425828 RepID=A0AAW2DE86_9ROSI
MRRVSNGDSDTRRVSNGDVKGAQVTATRDRSSSVERNWQHKVSYGDGDTRRVRQRRRRDEASQQRRHEGISSDGNVRWIVVESAPYSPESIKTILQDVQKYIIPRITHWQSPNYFAYFPSSGSIAGFLGEMLSTGFNVVGFNWMSSPTATELECIVMDWLGEMLKLPKSFLFSGNGGGVLQGTTCEAILSTLTAARDQMLSQVGREKMEKLVVYGSDQTHSAIQKAAKIAGINPMNLRAVKTTKSTSFGLCPKSLHDAVQADVQAGLVPFFLCATVGTTSTNAIDPIGPLCEVAKDYSIWVHVDVAYAGSACICPEFPHFIDGIC